MSLNTDSQISAETEFETVIGLEVHAQLRTQSKAFAPVTIAFGGEPNTQVTPLCLGHPGTLPRLNENLVRFIVKMGLATECSIAPKSIFARKNYFYPDLPKGYQISQYETPICSNGKISIELEGGIEKVIRINRIHMEEDAGKSIHDIDPSNTLVDLNRAGTPLIEIVSEPDLRSPQEAFSYLTKIRQIVQYLGICDGNMEEGSLRCDANISIRPKGQDVLGTRTEIKNLNSFRNVERAITYEAERQKQVILSGGKIIQTTLLWDPNKLETKQIRSKEEAHDYRYFPDPDIPPVYVSKELLDELKLELPELPEVRLNRFVSEFGLTQNDAETLTDSKSLADYFESVLENTKHYKLVSNIILTEVMRVLNDQSIEIKDFSIEPKQLAGLIELRACDKISSSAMQTIFNTMLQSSEEAEEIAKSLNLIQVSDTSFLIPIVESVINNNPNEVSRYREGKKGLIGFFVGQVMKQSAGKANPQMVSAMVRELLESEN